MAPRSLLALLRAEPNMVTLPNNAGECHDHAQCCANLARTSATAEDREQFASLATSWIRLAAEIEGALVVLNALDQIEFDKPKYFDETEAA
jgi:hypothetical protein